MDSKFDANRLDSIVCDFVVMFRRNVRQVARREPSNEIQINWIDKCGRFVVESTELEE